MQQDLNHMNDEEIVSMALRDKAFFAHIVLRYEDKLSRYILRLGIRNAEDRQDVLQEIFIKIYKNLNGFDTSLSFSSWVYRIAHNEAISSYRKKNVRPEGHLIEEGNERVARELAYGDGAEKQFDEKINATEVYRALSLVDTRYKDALILRFFEHKEYEEISDILKIPIGSVGTLLHRGKKQLQEKLDTRQLHI
ncbi:MAG: RNA polymerase sigma-70 factor (ECF subfamily) [Acidimicrobiales bacterium]|jgi:RNA polymerase sigma-70 factor (ECF subfamily)